jgi:hypothetical protein
MKLLVEAEGAALTALKTMTTNFLLKLMKKNNIFNVCRLLRCTFSNYLNKKLSSANI